MPKVAPSDAPRSEAAPVLRLVGAACWQGADGRAGELGPQRRHQVLALLGYTADWVGRDRLAGLFWPARPDRAARANLRKVLHELRALQVPGLEEGAAGLRWRPGSDVELFRQACERGDWPLAAELGAGTLMPGLDGLLGNADFDEWLRIERQRWQAAWREAALRAAACSDGARALQWAEKLLDVDALDEAAMALALRAAAAMDRPEKARTLWLRHVGQLRVEQGLAPSAALQALAAGRAAPRLAPLSPLVGRETELDELIGLLGRVRLVTVLGTGGVGKTRLARHAADAMALRCADGAGFVALDDARTPRELPSRVAAALGIEIGPADDPVAALARALAPKSLLLVLDGFEGVIDAAPALLRLLGQAPGLRIVVTSRERLGIDGEWVLPLAGLDAPAPGASDEGVLQSRAVALFTTRARAMNPAFDAQAALGPVAEICRRLGGLPLALELAASWIRLLPAADIAAALARGIEFLGQGSDVDLNAVFERSWALLTATERDAQARLAVFCGGFTREAARQVAGVELATLAALVDKSMLAAQPDGRFDMHALLSSHARRKLGARADAGQVHEAHSRWFLAWSQQPGAALSGELDNLLAAWRNAVARRDTAALDAVLFTLPWSSLVRGHIGQAVDLLRQAQESMGAATVAGAQLLAQQGWLLLWQGRREQAESLAQQALAVLRPAGDTSGTVMALRTLGHAARQAGRHALAVQHLGEGLDLARDAGLSVVQALMQDGLAMALNMLGRFEQAQAALRAAMSLQGDGSATVQHVYPLYNMAQSHSLAGQPAQALPWAERALAMAQQVGHGYFLPHVHVELAHILTALQRFDPAGRQVALARITATEHHNPAALAAMHEAAARLGLACGDTASALRESVAAARLCLERDETVTGASVVLTAALAHGADPRARRWLRDLLALQVVQEPVRQRALQALQALPTTGGVQALPPTPAVPSLASLLAEVIAAA